jgi:hypothetical protein
VRLATLTATSMKSTVVWEVGPGVGVGKNLSNVGQYLPDYIVLHSRI